ncbi:hypothetical protein T12_8588 [Trichinella patagoniensis]|uniref:Uncharacterized protein n=1 Tax=Trichinella patagoniensis TaxID=990121 RepID=A0A0V0Z9Y4_9BILA|nr:hypothetical protein T12_8588 [Trichinella patagoniensis]
MLHLTHRTLDVFWQLRHRFFSFIISGQCATLSNLAAVVGSGLLTRLLLVSVFAVTDTRPRDFLAYALFTFVKASATSNVNHPFTTATWSVQNKFFCTIFYFGGLSDTMLATSAPNLRRPGFSLSYSTVLLYTQAVCKHMEGTLTSPFQLFRHSFQWCVLQSVSPNRSDGHHTEAPWTSTSNSAALEQVPFSITFQEMLLIQTQLSENSNYTRQHRREIAQQYDSKVSDGSTV